MTYIPCCRRVTLLFMAFVLCILATSGHRENVLPRVRYRRLLKQKSEQARTGLLAAWEVRLLSGSGAIASKLNEETRAWLRSSCATLPSPLVTFRSCVMST